jgi:hypothetical protein
VGPGGKEVGGLRLGLKNRKERRSVTSADRRRVYWAMTELVEALRR